MIETTTKTVNAKNDLSPEKEQEIAQKILERAELAQMTRQLKFGLSRVATPKSNRVTRSPQSRRKMSVGAGSTSHEHIVTKFSPLKKGLPFAQGIRNSTSNTSLSHALENSNPNENSKNRFHRISFSEANINLIDAQTQQPQVLQPTTHVTSLRKEVNILQPTNTNKRDSQKRDISDIKEVRIIEPPSTPGRGSPNKFDPKFQSSATKLFMMTPNRNPRTDNNLNNGENDIGADLLMYLAASPYTGTIRSPAKGALATGAIVSNHGGLSSAPMTKVPSTPSSSLIYRQMMTDLHDPLQLEEQDQPIRLSHIKTSISSPNVNLTNSFPGANTTFSQNVGLGDVLLDSPTLFSAATPSNQKKKSNAIHGNSTLLSFAPTTPSRELRSSGATANLLKTPNFNMGDYIHNLFSPSPNVNSLTFGGMLQHTTLNRAKSPVGNMSCPTSLPGDTARFELKHSSTNTNGK
ncbi:hypothetical protein TBLA_0A07720 [Henningerozyma blattae CBS 6284]|uniref:Uncharacterized protein n=1 Tax=Henningerozyma blattae (strain ATCC 34711 / CBS 6284 / DSM 70876 / NBRC 10599 / NRRL Y-10934 / UCD 77-7) TaxID=1071380 RepID=I2GWQ9_HENB6|nr:hypothetical protein TBLA_0A07720 [Tetrapisispora blattae CBS 6284]CCH58561.1 hypothetical protein TBLA_0A07720 [Tetrapisispora blattae CBS 6284]